MLFGARIPQPGQFIWNTWSALPRLLTAVTDIEGFSWVGSNTATAGIEKQWRCRLSSGSDDIIPDLNGLCFVTTVDDGRVQSVRAPFVLVRVESYGDLCHLHKSGTVYRIGISETHDRRNGKRVVARRDSRRRRRREDGNGNQIGDRSRHRDGDGNGCGGFDVSSG
ncbi:hypothetical protein LY76DRAFT_600618 [Colletotrichum caudatum]|nr:hypothetical protein LY76DRAFT_600618 [Colletotrichum caudatum]